MAHDSTIFILPKDVTKKIMKSPRQSTLNLVMQFARSYGFIPEMRFGAYYAN